MSVQGSDNLNLDAVCSECGHSLGSHLIAGGCTKEWDACECAADPADALVAEVRSLRQENEQLRAKITAVEALCNVVRALQDPDPDTGDRMVSFFGLLDALDADDSAAVPETTGAVDA